MQVATGMQESQRFEGGAIWTPSTKAEQGEHDENISKAKAIEIVGEDIAKKIEKVSLEIYKMVSLFCFNLCCGRVVDLSLQPRAGTRLRLRTRHHHCRHQA
jgi:hypothetical protein